MRVCDVDWCDKPHRARGYCSTHYNQMRYTGTLRLKGPRVCKVDGCDKKHTGHGFCNAHYLADRRKNQTTPCSFIGCERTRHTRGLCSGHYRQLQQGKVLAPIEKQDGRRKQPESCRYPGCDDPCKSHNLCAAHYLAYWRAQNPEKYEEQNKKNAARRREARQASQ